MSFFEKLRRIFHKGWVACTTLRCVQEGHGSLIFPKVQHNPPLYIHPCFWCAGCALSFHAWSLFLQQQVKV